MQMPQWLGIVETLTFLGMIGVVAYNRLVSWKKFNERTYKLEVSFEQYQKDVAIFFDTCRVCRSEVIDHHEDVERHVTPDMRKNLERVAEAVDEIKSLLMQASVGK